MITIFLLTLVSFLAGFLDSIAGGGGLLMLPALLLAGIPPQNVLGTNKLAAVLGTSTALFNFIRKKKVVWKIGIAGILFTLVGGFLGAKAILFFDNQTIGKIIVFLLPFGVIASLMPKHKIKTQETLSKKDLYFKAPLICLLIGFYDGFFGPGTGSFFILFFSLFLSLGLVESSATAKLFNLVSNLGALIMFIINGNVIYYLGLPLALANILGNYCGSQLTIKKGDKIVKNFLLI